MSNCLYCKNGICKHLNYQTGKPYDDNCFAEDKAHCDYYTENELVANCKCQQRAMINILDCDGGTVDIDFEYRKFIAEIFNSNGTSKRNVTPIKYCPFCGREL